jgi:glycosyltransferase involved in cell wall biosynthesis
MKILVVQETDWFERGPLQQNHLMEILSLRGHEIRVIDHEILWPEKRKKDIISKREVFEDIWRIYDKSSITVIRPPIVKLPPLDYISLVISRKKEIERQIKEFKPDIIVGFFMISAYLGMKAAKKHNIPFIYYWIDIYHSQIPFKLYQPLGKVIEKKILVKANAVIAINEKLRERVIKMGSNPKYTCIERAGIDLNRFNSDISGKNIRKEYGFSDDDIVLTFVGVLYNFSGLKEVAIEFSKIKKEYPHIKFLIVGDGDAFSDLKKIQKELNIEKQVIIAGRQPFDKIPEFIAASDICLLPAYKTEIMVDIVPIKMYEYMGMGKPVIATSLPGVMLEFGEDNGVFYVNEPADILNKAIEIIKSNNINEEGKKAKKFVQNNDWDTIADHFEMIMKKISKYKLIDPKGI